MSDARLTASASANPAYSCLVLASHLHTSTTFEDVENVVSLHINGEQITSQKDVLYALGKLLDSQTDSPKISSFLTLAERIPTLSSFQDTSSALDSLDDHLALRTFLIGVNSSVADWAVWGAIKGSVKILGLLKNNKHVHLSRWFSYFEGLETTQAALASLADARTAKTKAKKSDGSSSASSLVLPNVEVGKVVTRFPPEPSGYLHIGHAKAAMLNQFFAQTYKGKMIIRFDDTNPSKERMEFEDTILEDLNLLGIHGDRVTHTSDYFDQLYEDALEMIRRGKAYADDTEQMQMRQERFDGIASKRRDASIEKNIARFEEMKKGTREGQRWCIRAKISIDNPNKAMRDPVVYRVNILPHHRTGDKWKVYPTYDFACPIVDALEGVTHALRTIEYRDRNAQYYWMLEALGLRKVHVWDFSRLNFIYTLLSKRKLLWFVDQKIVRGWDDPRFPTVRGIRRRGLTIEALRQFMILQGPSQALVSLEWDSIWAINRKIIDPVTPRFWAITSNRSVPTRIVGGPSSSETKALPLHKKNPEIGEKQTVYSSNILLEQDDVVLFDDQEEITLMDWGNAIVRSKITNSDGSTAALELQLHLEGDFRTTKKKITWLSAPTEEHKLAEVTLIDYDYLITKKKLEENDDVADFVTPVSEFREDGFADANVLKLQKGATIQFERKGYYLFDGVNADTNRHEFIHIPDGKATSIASKTAPNASNQKSATNVKPSNGNAALSDGTPGYQVPVNTALYTVKNVYGENVVVPPTDSKMYKVHSVYDV